MGSSYPFSNFGAGRAVCRKNQHWNGAGSDRAATVRAFPASAIWHLEERVGTGAFEACLLQGQHWGSGDLPVVARLRRRRLPAA